MTFSPNGASATSSNAAGLPRDPAARRLWDEYFARAAHVVRRLPAAERDEVLDELRSHLAASMAAGGTTSGERDRLIVAVERLGRPDDYLRPLVTDALMEEGVRTYHPGTLATALYNNVYLGLRAGVVSVVFAIGYLVVLIFALMALGKAVFPSHVGLFRYPSGAQLFGIFRDTTGARDVLGYWVVPVTLVGAVFLYVVLTAALRRTRRS